MSFLVHSAGLFAISLTLSAAPVEEQASSAQGAGVPLANGADATLAPEGVLICPTLSKSVFLHDLTGRQIKEWKVGLYPAGAPRLLPNGGLLHIGALHEIEGLHARFKAAVGHGGVVQKWSPDGHLQWRFQMASDRFFIHDDVVPLRNGNVLMLVWRWISSDEALTAGRLPDYLQLDGFWSDEVWEVEPAGDIGGTIIWQWSAWEHRVQDTTPEISHHGNSKTNWHSLNLNYPPIKVHAWADLKRIECDEEQGLIAVWSRTFNEVWIIDHRVPHPFSDAIASPSDQAKPVPPKAGLLFRLGNPGIFGRQATLRDLMIGLKDIAFVQRGGQPHLALLHGYKVKSKGVTKLTDFLPCASFRALADASQPSLALPTDGMLNLEQLGIPDAEAINAFFPLSGERWLVTAARDGKVMICEPGKAPRTVHQLPIPAANASKAPNQFSRAQDRPLILRASAYVGQQVKNPE